MSRSPARFIDGSFVHIDDQAAEAFRAVAAEKVQPRHLELMRQFKGSTYLMVPQADEWEPVVGFVPEQNSFHEVGFMVADEEAGHSILLARLLISREEDKPFLYIDWYPSNYEARERPY